jgi:hypothetical protein
MTPACLVCLVFPALACGTTPRPVAAPEPEGAFAMAP